MYGGGTVGPGQGDSALPFSHLVALQSAGILQEEEELRLQHAELGGDVVVGVDDVVVDVVGVVVDVVAADGVGVVGELEVTEDDDLDVGCDVSLVDCWVFLAERRSCQLCLWRRQEFSSVSC